MAAIPVHVFLLKTLECLPIAFQAKESSLTIRGEPSVICPPAYQTPSGLSSSRNPGLFAHLEHCTATPATGSLLCLLSPFSMLFPESVFSLIIEDALRWRTYVTLDTLKAGYSEARTGVEFSLQALWRGPNTTKVRTHLSSICVETCLGSEMDF